MKNNEEFSWSTGKTYGCPWDIPTPDDSDDDDE